MRIAYLGPAGTFTEDALREALASGEEFEPLRTPTIHDAILAVERGEAERALVPFENSIEGSVRSTLDTLAFDAERGDDRRRARLRRAGDADRPRAASSWSRSRGCSRTPSRSPSAPASCASTCPAPSAQSVEQHRRGGAGSSASPRRPGPRSAPARRPSSTAARSCARGSRTRPTTSPASSGSRRRAPSRVAAAPGRPRSSSPSSAKTTPAPWSTPCSEFSSREVNLTRIESRPLRLGLGRYMFFCDLEGALFGDRRCGGR